MVSFVQDFRTYSRNTGAIFGVDVEVLFCIDKILSVGPPQSVIGVLCR
jgi:hypothetical protein